MAELIAKPGGLRTVPSASTCCVHHRDNVAHALSYFTTACRTKVRRIHHYQFNLNANASSQKGLTMILIPRGDGVETRPIKTAYSSTAGTAYVTFDNVKVPVENTLGKEDQGLKIVLRFACTSCGFAQLPLISFIATSTTSAGTWLQ